jgi:exonuclease VII small subunit
MNKYEERLKMHNDALIRAQAAEQRVRDLEGFKRIKDWARFRDKPKKVAYFDIETKLPPYADSRDVARNYILQQGDFANFEVAFARFLERFPRVHDEYILIEGQHRFEACTMSLSEEVKHLEGKVINLEHTNNQLEARWKQQYKTIKECQDIIQERDKKITELENKNKNQCVVINTLQINGDRLQRLREKDSETIYNQNKIIEEQRKRICFLEADKKPLFFIGQRVWDNEDRAVGTIRRINERGHLQICWENGLEPDINTSYWPSESFEPEFTVGCFITDDSNWPKRGRVTQIHGNVLIWSEGNITGAGDKSHFRRIG